MTDDKPQKPIMPSGNADDGDPLETLHVPPPNFRERIAAAQRARTNEIRPNIEAPGQNVRNGDSSNKLSGIEETKPSPTDFLSALDDSKPMSQSQLAPNGKDGNNVNTSAPNL